MKKLLAILLVLALTLSLAACGGNSDKKPTFDNALDEGKYYYEQGDYLAAIEALKTIYAVDPLYKEAKPLIDEITRVYVDDIIVEIDSMVEAGEVVDAISLMKRARLTVTDKVLLQKYEEVVNIYVADLRNKVDAAFEEKGFKCAEELINEAVLEVPDEPAIPALLEEYRVKASKYFGTDIPVLGGVPYQVVIKKAPVSDFKGVEYVNGAAISYDGSGTATLTFDLGKKYSTLYATVTTAADSDKDSKALGSVQISNGGSTIFNNAKITPTFNKELSAPISSADKITVRIKNATVSDLTVKPMVIIYVM